MAGRAAGAEAAPAAPLAEPAAPFGTASVIRGIAYPTDIAAGADGNLWFTNFNNDSIGRITPAGTVSNFTDPGIHQPTGIAAGPDGNVWFTNVWNDSIGRITPEGVVTLFKGEDLGRLRAITAGADGNLWFTTEEFFSDPNLPIGRITPEGVITRFAAPPLDDDADIAAGPDGNLWFTDDTSIGRISPGGVVSTFAGPGIDNPVGITPGPDGNVWFTNSYPASIGRITPAGVVSTFTSPIVRGPNGIATGPDGNLWFTDGDQHAIGRITRDGVITSFAAPDHWGSVFGPTGITAGPDGNVWFTSASASSIGRVTPGGVITYFTGSGINEVAGMVAGPDANVWFTNRANDSIGRVTPTGVVSRFTGPGIDGPTGIAAGPDGNLWFTNSWGASIGRITPTGTITTFTRTGLYGPTAIVSGPDGNLWFTSKGGRSIGRITTAGVISTFTDPRLAGPTEITAGPDGNLWFVDDASPYDDLAGAIGRITPAGEVSIFTGPGIDAPRDIAPGPDGNVWFTDWSTGDDGSEWIGRITPAGVVTTFTGPEVPSPEAIAAGPDGALWFGNFTGQFLGRITPEGALSRFDTDRIYPDVITAGPDGRMWFAGSNSVGRVATETTVPGPPVGVTAVAGDASATVSWSAPAFDGGLAVTAYRVTASPGGQTCTWSGGPLSCPVTVLANGSASTFVVVAVNPRGVGPASAPSRAVVPFGVPGAPLGVTAAVGDGRATVTWTAPAFDGGSPVTGYRVTASPGGQSCVWAPGPLSCTVTGLANETPSTFTVMASNARGPGPASAPSGPVTPTDGLAFHPLSPTRVLDSRPAGPGVGPYTTPWGPGQTRQVTVAGVGGVPAGAGAVVMNVAVTGTTAAGYLTVWPAGRPQPLVSSLNWAAGATVSNAVTMPVGAGGTISVLSSAGSTHVIVDLVGWYGNEAGERFTSLTPQRVLDSRKAGPQVGPYATPWAAGQARTATVAGLAGVPAAADAVVLNVTATSTTSGGFLSIWPAGEARPNASSLNWAAGQTVANAVTVKVGAAGGVSVFNQAGSADVIFDVVGFFTPGGGHLFHPLPPTRIQDSRPTGPQAGPYGTSWAAGTTRGVQVGGVGGVPPAAVAAVVNVTATATTAASHLTIWPAGQALPLASSLNWGPGRTVPNAVTPKLGADGRISVRNETGNVHVIVDTAGWYG